MDDDIRSARVFVRMLREDGFDVEVAHDGAVAIGRLSRGPLPHVLVTDLHMPHADGIAVAKYARSCDPTLPIFMVTGYPELIAAHARAFDPAPRVFTKPLDYPTFAKELDRTGT
ncbi:response regulator [Polyangium sp. 6x1]|uniref:response regulator n=1 Tax=Polyangium sp. 6x1 TaxID=3042689 RepID=UPI002482E217|nr:response regulator [Polyangium sp. 6x1]MDI1447582.1 response regulator [Polyangium sp. 6x1]